MTGSRKHFQDFFVVGCRAGDKISFLPLPGSDDRDLLEFIDRLSKVDRSREARERISRIQGFKELANVPENEKEEGARIIEECFDAINSIPNAIRNNSDDEEFAWFHLGFLLFGVRTCTFTSSRKHDDDDSVEGVLVALEAHAESCDLPKAISRELASLVVSVREGPEFDDMSKKITILANAIMGYLGPG